MLEQPVKSNGYSSIQCLLREFSGARDFKKSSIKFFGAWKFHFLKYMYIFFCGRFLFYFFELGLKSGPGSSIYSSIYTYIYIYTSLYIYIYTCLYIYIYIYIYIYNAARNWWLTKTLLLILLFLLEGSTLHWIYFCYWFLHYLFLKLKIWRHACDKAIN